MGLRLLPKREQIALVLCEERLLGFFFPPMDRLSHSTDERLRLRESKRPSHKSRGRLPPRAASPHPSASAVAPGSFVVSHWAKRIIVSSRTSVSQLYPDSNNKQPCGRWKEVWSSASESDILHFALHSWCLPHPRTLSLRIWWTSSVRSRMFFFVLASTKMSAMTALSVAKSESFHR
jgi:hypothetical protein